MAVSASMQAAPQAPDHGDTITITYVVTGNDGTAPSTEMIAGQVVVGGVSLDLSTSVRIPGTPAASVSYEVPTGAGLTFVQGATANTFTAVVP